MKRLCILLLGMLLLVGCGAVPVPDTPAMTPQAPPPVLATPAPPLRVAYIPAAEPVQGISEQGGAIWETHGPLRGWWDIRWFYGGGLEQEFEGVLVDGSREGNRVAIHMVKEEAELFVVGSIYLYTADGREASMPIISNGMQYAGDCELMCADLDGDGTDEIILFYGIHSTGGEGDLHVFTYKNGELTELYTLINGFDNGTLREVYRETLGNTASCNGARVIRTEEGLALRVFLYDQSSSGRVYGELLYREAGLQPLREYEAYTGQMQKEYVRALLPGFAGAEKDVVYLDFWGSPVSLAQAGEPGGGLEDVLYIHAAYAADPPSAFILLEGRQSEKAGRLLRSLEVDDLGGHLSYVQDLDGDGNTEVLLLLHRGAGETERFELHLMRLVQGALVELLQYDSSASELLQPGAEALFRLPLLGAGMPFADEQALNASTGWAEAARYGGGYCIDLQHMDADGTVLAISRLAAVNGVWTLVEQGTASPPGGEEPEGEQAQPAAMPEGGSGAGDTELMELE